MTELSHAELLRLLEAERHRRHIKADLLLGVAILCAWVGSCNLYDVDDAPVHRIDPGVTVVMPAAGQTWHEIAPADAGDTRLPKAEDAGE